MFEQKNQNAGNENAYAHFFPFHGKRKDHQRIAALQMLSLPDYARRLEAVKTDTSNPSYKHFVINLYEPGSVFFTYI